MKSALNSFTEEVCGNCIWFNTRQGESDLTCQDRTKATKETKACKDFTLKPFNPVEIKKTDSFIIKIRKELASKRFILDTSILDELKSYFVICQSFKEGGKRLRRVPICSYGPKEASELVSLFEETQAKRDRALAIKLGMMSILTELKSKEALGRQYISEYYGKYFQIMKSEAMREVNIKNLLDPLSDKIRAVSHILNTANLIYDNLKDTYFSLKEISNLACAFLMSTRLEK